MQPFLEKIAGNDEASWSMLNRRLDAAIPFEWHHHPEFELTLTLNSRGQRFVGDHIGAYDHGDLVLLGPGLPHTWASTEKIDPEGQHIALVMWFKPEWAAGLTRVLTELRLLNAMFDKSARGLRFSRRAADRARPAVEALFEKPPAERLLDLISVLTLLSADEAAEPLAAPNYHAPNMSAPDGPRIDRVLAHIHAHYAEPVTIDQLADIAALSPSGFHRLFRRHTRLTLTEYVARLRIGEACALLATSSRPIANISDTVGYRSLANFNRQFRAIKNLTPRQYRQKFLS